MTLGKKSETIRKKIAGNREYDCRQMWQGAYPANLEWRTEMTKMNSRIVNVLHVAINLSGYHEHQFDSLISDTMDFLLDTLNTEGVLCDSIGRTAVC